ncbi:hypothetical protein MJT46_000010 [Ovis ammon polii x Ovis aries]|nr:hypothetical protein MJT46_000010 [Ovis ammon polii x Ovis aries]
MPDSASCGLTVDLSELRLAAALEGPLHNRWFHSVVEEKDSLNPSKIPRKPGKSLIFLVVIPASLDVVKVLGELKKTVTDNPPPKSSTCCFLKLGDLELEVSVRCCAFKTVVNREVGGGISEKLPENKFACELPSPEHTLPPSDRIHPDHPIR